MLLFLTVLSTEIRYQEIAISLLEEKSKNVFVCIYCAANVIIAR